MVRVQFGKRKHMTGIVWRTHSERPPFVVKPVEERLDVRLTVEQMRFWEWLAEYYVCSLGEVMAAALPSALRPEGMSAEDFAERMMKPRKRRAKGVFSGVLPELPETLPVLSDAQQEAVEDVKASEKGVVLLHGVTGSGKTEIYIRLIVEELKMGRNVLYLLPEIAMGSQLVGRVREWFGERVVVYNSRMTPRQRAEAWERVAVGEEGIVVLGVRSALLLPLRNLGLIVVDEEHDRSYKQEDPAPRYCARDAAIVLGGMMGARTVLGSATPSLESYHNARRGKYGYVYLGERYGGSELPRVVISNTLKAVERGERTTHFNKVLLDKLQDTLEGGRQAMLFQNRRGFAPYIECAECGAAVMCRQCNVAMTWHKDDGVLRCHYCGRSTKVPAACPTCGAAALEPRGFGTQKVEKALEELFPEARIERLDRDVAGHEGIIGRFEAGETDILVGTQMITKGFDFGGVGLVGILNADNLLAYPDFRAAERAFQTLTQMSGRGGRRGGERAEVVIQTVRPQEPLIRQVAEGDYFSMARDQLAERREFLYPPFCRLVEIRLYGRYLDTLWATANNLASRGRAVFGSMLLGPQPALVDKVKNEHILTLLLKITDLTSRRKLADLLASFTLPKSLRISCDVDPQ